MQETTVHSVSIEQRKKITVQGVANVLAFCENKITLLLIGGTKFFVVGNALKIDGFSASSGAFTASGDVQGVSYGGKSFTAKLFR